MIIYENGQKIEISVVEIYQPFPDPKPIVKEDKEKKEDE